MRHILVLLLLLSNIAFGQSLYLSGKVKEVGSQKALQYVNVTIPGTTIGTATDSLGRFSINIENHQDAELRFSIIGHQTRSLDISELLSPVNVYLLPSTTTLNELIVRPGENPAWALLRKVHENADDNNPLKYKTFKADFYAKTKMHITDIERNPEKPKKDSTKKGYMNLLMLENIGGFYAKNGQQKEVVKHTISNLPKMFPVNLVFINSLNPLGFYEPYYRFRPTFSSSSANAPVFERNYVNPIKPGVFNQYDFQLTDTLITGQDSTFLVKFQPNQGKALDALKGYLKINSDGYALSYIEAQPADTIQALQFKITQAYSKAGDKWYPTTRKIDLDYPYEDKGRTAMLRMDFSTYFSNISDNIPNGEVYFDGTTRQIGNTAHEISKKEFDEIRPKELNEKEKITYAKWSFDNKPKLKKTVEIMEWPYKLIAPTGPVMLMFDQFGMNYHEKLRLGLGLQNNLTKNPRIGLRASAGYGLGDKSWKYRTSASFHITKDRYNKVTVYKRKDISPPGQQTYLGHNYLSPSARYIYFNPDGYLVDEFIKTGVAVYTRPIRWTWIKFYAENDDKKALNYQIDENTSTETNYRTYGFMLRFVPRESYVRQGIFETLGNRNYPVININAQKSFDRNSNSSFIKADFGITQQFRWKKIGTDILTLSAGYATGQIPYSYLFNNQGVERKLFGGNTNSFEAGDLTQYAYDQSITLNWIHSFGKNIFRLKTKWSQPEIAIGHRFAWSRLTTETNSSEIELKDFSNGNYEANLYLYNLVRLKVFGVYFGLGAKTAYNYSQDFIGTRRFVVRPTFSLALF
ncbi:DUF5686 and carboxypeptidase-like regulatory domain-containing protein [Arcticibacterium luteifluviistationis]|uniref:Carboxypeptidase-like regulatory domain-containing protein n=1 Tax=Arcticibacterium luteifluviistationis TaxID=1784714 RepID=A0A2Z4GDI5_9BACT|nr:DUF5686 and carboxypeptidase-like regulatory domain-containing protein [Arcticibacterium luteifluviistationis]AWV99180.1 hypothetical protein DJ013_13785 [Arcticibacterium luteifluviistationis]